MFGLLSSFHLISQTTSNSPSLSYSLFNNNSSYKQNITNNNIN